MSILEFILKIPGTEWLMKKMFRTEDNSLHREIMELRFANPIGLAAGFDKDARYIRSMSVLGFGFIEVGTVTPLPQPGNEKPRLFRLAKDRALINRMGFNNDGVDVVAARIKTLKSSHHWKKMNVIIGGNIGKNKSTPNENAADDYAKCFIALKEVVDYFVVNVSSPNTPGLRELQEREPLKKILFRLNDLNTHQRPILLKIAPDINDDQLNDIISIALETHIAGIVATNTSIGRNNLLTASEELAAIGSGGLSGRPLSKRSTEIIRQISSIAKGKLVIIGSGGIETAEDAADKLNAGADLVQVYTGMIYEGPSIVKKITSGLIHRYATNPA